MIEIKLNELLDCTTTLQELAKKPMKTKVAFQTARIMREIEKEYNLFQDTRIKLIEKYGEKDENNELKIDENNSYVIKKEDIKTFNQELREVLNSIITLNVEPINLKDLDNINFTPGDMMLLAPFVKE